MISFKATGIEETIRKFNELDIKVHTKILRSGVNDISAELAHRLQSAAPVGISKSNASVKWGPLRDHIKETMAKLNRKREAILSTIRMPFYWRFLEFGTDDRYNKAGAYRGKMSDEARFLNPVIETFASSSLKTFTDRIATDVTKYWKHK